MVKIERQTFLYYHVYLLRDIKFIGYVANNFGTRKFCLRGKSQPYELSKKKEKSNFDIDQTFGALEMIALSFSSYQIEK